MSANKKLSAQDAISELVAKESINDTLVRKTSLIKAIKLNLRIEEHYNLLKDLIEFVKLEPSAWDITKDKDIKALKVCKISRIDFTNRMCKVYAYLKENFLLVNKKEYEYLYNCMNNTQKKEYSKLFESE